VFNSLRLSVVVATEVLIEVAAKVLAEVLAVVLAEIIILAVQVVYRRVAAAVTTAAVG